MKLSDLGLHAPASADPLLAAGEALEAQAELQGRIVAAYYTALRANGVPLELAEKLTSDWHGWRRDSRFWLEPPRDGDA